MSAPPQEPSQSQREEAADTETKKTILYAVGGAIGAFGVALLVIVVVAVVIVLAAVGLVLFTCSTH